MNYIILGVAVILIILMMFSNKKEGFREGIASQGYCHSDHPGNPGWYLAKTTDTAGWGHGDYCWTPAGEKTAYGQKSCIGGGGRAGCLSACKNTSVNCSGVAAPPPVKPNKPYIAKDSALGVCPVEDEIHTVDECVDALKQLGLPTTSAASGAGGRATTPYQYFANQSPSYLYGCSSEGDGSMFMTSKADAVGWDRNKKASDQRSYRRTSYYSALTPGDAVGTGKFTGKPVSYVNRGICKKTDPQEPYFAKDSTHGVCPPEDQINDLEECKAASLKFGGARTTFSTSRFAQRMGGCARQGGTRDGNVTYFKTAPNYTAEEKKEEEEWRRTTYYSAGHLCEKNKKCFQGGAYTGKPTQTIIRGICKKGASKAPPKAPPPVDPTPKCPNGWDQVGDIGADVQDPGSRTRGGTASYSKANIQQCSDWCRGLRTEGGEHESRCKAFIWAPLNGDKNNKDKRVCTGFWENEGTSPTDLNEHLYPGGAVSNRKHQAVDGSYKQIFCKPTPAPPPAMPPSPPAAPLLAPPLPAPAPRPLPPPIKREKLPNVEIAPVSNWCRALDGPLVDDPSPQKSAPWLNLEPPPQSPPPVPLPPPAPKIIPAVAPVPKAAAAPAAVAPAAVAPAAVAPAAAPVPKAPTKPACPECGNVAIESAQFPGSYLDAGGNRKVWTAQKPYSANNYRKWNIIDIGDGKRAIESLQFPGSYLDAGGDRKVWTAQKSYNANNYRKWKINDIGGGKVAIESLQFPKSYLDAGGNRKVHSAGPYGSLGAATQNNFRKWSIIKI
jgi:hypothetical protein